MNKRILILPTLVLFLVGVALAANPETSSCSYASGTTADKALFQKDTDSLVMKASFSTYNISNATFYLSGLDGNEKTKSYFVAASGTNTTITKTVKFSDVGIKDARTYTFYVTFDMNNNTVDNGYTNFTDITEVACPVRTFTTDFDSSGKAEAMLAAQEADIPKSSSNKSVILPIAILLLGGAYFAMKKK